MSWKALDVIDSIQFRRLLCTKISRETSVLHWWNREIVTALSYYSPSILRDLLNIIECNLPNVRQVMMSLKILNIISADVRWNSGDDHARKIIEVRRCCIDENREIDTTWIHKPVSEWVVEWWFLKRNPERAGEDNAVHSEKVWLILSQVLVVFIPEDNEPSGLCQIQTKPSEELNRIKSRLYSQKNWIKKSSKQFKIPFFQEFTDRPCTMFAGGLDWSEYWRSNVKGSDKSKSG
jgi:hypothetical protein